MVGAISFREEIWLSSEPALSDRIVLLLHAFWVSPHPLLLLFKFSSSLLVTLPLWGVCSEIEMSCVVWLLSILRPGPPLTPALARPEPEPWDVIRGEERGERWADTGVGSWCPVTVRHLPTQWGLSSGSAKGKGEANKQTVIKDERFAVILSSE